MQNSDDRSKIREDFDRALDAALAKYASAEPRVGLEQRILASLRAADVRKPSPFWNWGGVMALAVVLICSTALVWRWSRPAHPPIAVHPSVPQIPPVTPEVANREGNTQATRAKTVRHVKVRHRSQPEVAATNPKLDVFPSPLPLSEQEKLLAIYVGEYPEQAALVAEGRMADLRQEAEQRQQLIAGQQDEKQ